MLKEELLTKLNFRDLVSYLQHSSAWNEVSVKEGWQLFVSSQSVTGVELELILPQTQDRHIFPNYASNAVDILSQLSGEQPELIVERVSNVDRDVLLIRNIGERYKNSISLRLAARQVNKLQTIIRQASNSEKDASPYYRKNYYNPLATRMASEFQFGHTQDRSFGLTVKTPVLVKPVEYKQLSLGIEKETVETLPPAPRRIVERVIRGLLATKAAVSQFNVNALVHSYESGFSSNMCKAVVGLSRNKESSIEYGVLWSPIIAPSRDIEDFTSTRLLAVDYGFLETAAEKMKSLQPDDMVKVRGTIDGLTSHDDPHKFGVGQSIVIKWENDNGRVIRVFIDLTPTEYLQAIQAHEGYRPIEARGILKEIGGKWRLLKPRDFRVVPANE